MSERYEAELRHALAEGLVSREEVEDLRARVMRLGRSPLELLREQGRLSEDTFLLLRREASAERVEAPMAGSDCTLAPGMNVPSGQPAARAVGQGPDFAPSAGRNVPSAPPADGPPAPRSEAPLTPGAAAPPERSAAPRSDDTLQPGTAAVSPESPTGREQDSAPPSRPDEPAFPIASWDRYQPRRFLGQGGMGRVFLAWDPRLRRDVALKFVRDDDPELARRFVSEARAQARVDHERVCRVYEVGEVQGKVYIAMQYVDGRPLNALAGELTVEQKVMLLREAAEGVHAAHRAGLVHRDIKPSNVLVERTAEGALRPYVMDFGLARDWKEGVTATGTVLGTPHYMSPEQARGEVTRLDRRADVYSLGATLYALLTGQSPIPGDNGLEVLSNIATVEPRPPRAVDRDIPADVEAITLKCLEKDRSARYGSARELADDLGRFLDGAPVLARPGPGYRATRWLRKHRRVVAVVSAVSLVVALALGQAVLARREVTQRETLARRFTEGVERLEAQARYSGTAPLHDTRADREALRARMRDIESAMRNAGSLAEGPGHYALGRGFLALGDEAKAREHLETAWKQGYQEPRVAYALALVLGHLYQERRLEAERLRDAKARETRLREVSERYRDPALDFLRRSEGAEVPAPEYVAALLAFHEDRPDEALAKLDALGARLPWFHEAPQLRGDIHLARAVRRWSSGDREGATADFDAGRRAYAEAASIGRSVPAVHRALTRLEYEALIMEVYGKGEVLPPYSRGVEAVKRALTAARDDTQAHVLEAALHRRLAEHRARQGGEVEPLLDAAQASAKEAVALAPSEPRSLTELALVSWQRAILRQEKGQDASELLRDAAATFERIPAEGRDFDFHINLGLVYKVWADHEDSVGGDALPHRDRGVDAFRTAVELDARRAEAWTNLGQAYVARASHPRAPDADGDLTRAADAMERACTLNPGLVSSWFYAGEVHEARARRLRDSGGDARPELARALEAYRKGAAISPKLPPLHNGVGTILFEQAKEAWDRGAAPEPLLLQAQEAFARAIEVAPAQGFAHNNAGEVHAWHAASLLARGESPLPAVRAAEAVLQQAVALLPDLPQPRTWLGAVYRVEAAFALEQGRDAGPALKQSTEALRRALALNPGLAQAWLLQGETLALDARWRAAKGRARDEDFDAAALSFQKAVDLEPARPEHRVAFARFQLGWGDWRRQAGRDATPVLERGLALADAALAARAAWAEARAVRGGLLLALAELPGTNASGHKQQQRTQAREELTRALADNAHLRHTWAREQARLAGTTPR
ncbi:serine/threonine-protein kinase [Pyxidicoccus xibeiensis]|uniref:serine/threonine-protein kinase n=1 Tax=Pyxidicoccus xibeiensis TaxID=2906759 RepID=UPI0020A6E305|nr:protein kinase [Pyxidicoccus xibeiensis]MCP3137161.1 protein kinase [Pyxidicoccus xibeiensis]